ncbi:unnamed protein product [Parnassius apollo]|uniref:(apollo) hypothetical protein n=1 Tax=Parnassius apollo TaxID=110799 RepID=A0A8S3XY81_PARAO|nr:unnamed protein product [Parnassius apollo]
MASKSLLYSFIFILKLRLCWLQTGGISTTIPLNKEILKDVTTTDGDTCTSKLHTCSLKMTTKYLKGLAGPPGEKGDRGIDGPRGDTGSPGLQGIRGLPGVVMSDRSVWHMEMLGLVDNDDEYIELVEELSPVNDLCKDKRDKEKVIINGSKWKKELLPFEVTCDASGWSCLVSARKTTEFNYASEMEPFWLSKLNFSSIDFYGLTTHQLYYLQERASSAKMTIRYHCKNSVVLPENKNNSLRLLLWNDVSVGLDSDEETPFKYTVSNNNCKEQDDYESKWLYTDITIVSSIGRRLPVIDFLVRDVRNENQFLSLEVIDLCFR